MLQNENQDRESINEKPETETQNIQGRRDSGDKNPQKPRARERERENIIYQVHSAQERPRRRSKRPDDGGLVYTVRLSAWQCSCAAFAFAAFPREDMDLSRSDVDVDLDVDSDVDVHDGVREWEFGGLSFDGRGTGREKEKGGPPAVCKHLLACLLAERWEGVFGGFVKEREVGRGEGAGIGGA